jgi:putative ABC transport system permease protein
MQSALFGVEPLDAASFAAAPLVLLVVAAVACVVPATRAAFTDPARALRVE